MSATKPKLAERPTKEPVSYGGDFFAWTMDQARMLEDHRVGHLDWSNLAEEIRSLGNNEKNEIESRLAVLLQHLLKWVYQPDGRKGGWEATIYDQRRRIGRRISQSPSLKGYPAEVLEDEYLTAKRYAAAETGLPVARFPTFCPFTIEQVLDPDFWPDTKL
jgi:hypothetical protein